MTQPKKPRTSPPTPPAHEDERLLGAFRRGEEHAVELLFREALPWLEGLGRRWSRSADRRAGAAEDLAQETLLRAFRKRASFRGRSLPAFRGWLVRIARHRWLDLRKRAAREERWRLACSDLRGSEVPASVARSEARELRTPAAALLARERRELAFASLRHLAPEERLVLVLNELLGLPWETTTALLRRPTVKAARSFHARVRRKLGARLPTPDGRVRSQ